MIVARHSSVSGGSARNRTSQEGRKVRFLGLPFLPQAADHPDFQIGGKLERDVAADLALAHLWAEGHGPRSSVDGHEASIAHAVLSSRSGVRTIPRKLTLSRRWTAPERRGCRKLQSGENRSAAGGINLARACAMTACLPMTPCPHVSSRDLGFILSITFTPLI
jgi:hypothetical protein